MARPLRVTALQLRTFEARQHARAWEAALARVDQTIAGQALLVLPEATVPGWALISREATEALSLPPEDAWSAPLADRARRAGCAIAAGIVRLTPDGPCNGLALFGPDGRQLAYASEGSAVGWFSSGSGPVIAEIEGVRIGMVVGGDLARRDLVRRLAGVHLLIAATAARDTGRSPGAEPSLESDLLSARAALLGAWAICGGKSGSEAGLVRYAGDAGVVDPSGQWSVRAPVDRPGAASTEIDVDAAPGPAIDFATVPRVSGHGRPRGQVRGRAAAIAFDPLPSAVESMERLRALVSAAAAAGANLIVLPELAGIDPRAVTANETLPFLESLSTETRATICAGLAERTEGVTFKTAFMVEGGRVLASHRQSVLDRDERAAGFRAGGEEPPVVPTAVGPVALFCGAEGLVCATPAGAGAVAWCAGDAAAPVGGSARATALEDGVPVVAAGTTARAGGAYVIDPSGRVQAATPPGEVLVAEARL